MSQLGKPIGIDARAAAECAAGRGRYVRELLLALEALPEAQDERFVLYAREPGAILIRRAFGGRPSDCPTPRGTWRLRRVPHARPARSSPRTAT